MSGPRSARLVVVHGERGRLYGTPRRAVLEAAAIGRYPWPDPSTVELPRVQAPRPGGAARRGLRRRVWAWRLLLAAWLLLTGLAGWVGLRVAGPASLGCPAVMGVVLFALAWVASSDVREHQRTLRRVG